MMKVKNYFMTALLLLFSIVAAMAQQKTISGVISDESGLPIPGVNIIVKGPLMELKLILRAIITLLLM